MEGKGKKEKEKGKDKLTAQSHTHLLFCCLYPDGIRLRRLEWWFYMSFA